MSRLWTTVAAVAPGGGFAVALPARGGGERKPVAPIQPGPGGRAPVPVAGEWELEAVARDSSGTARAAPVRVRAVMPDAPGFVRRATGAGRNRYFQFENGRTYFPVGENLCWAGQRGLQDYEDWFAALH